MSFYNDEKYIGQAIESILKQNFPDFEFLIVNDGSKDKSSRIVKSFNDKRIRLIKNKKNLGLTKSLNIALSIAKGKYIARMDADDISLPNRLKNQTEFLDENKGIALVGCWVEFIDVDGKTTGIKKFPVEYPEIKRVLISYLPFRHPTLMIRKKILNEVGFYDENFHYAQDYELVLRIAAKFPVANLPEVLLKYRNWVTSSISYTTQKQQDFYALRARFKALKAGWYPFWQAIYAVKPVISFLIPSMIKKPFAKKLFYKTS